MTLIGRDREAAAVCGFLAELEGGPSMLVIEGEPGIGKTALFDAALGVASGLRVLTARCVEAESGLAYSGLADLFGSWTAIMLPALSAPLQRALEIVLLRADAGSNVLEPQVVGRAVLEGLRVLAAEARVLVAVDDVQWLDLSSTRALSFALRRLDAEWVSVLATRRETGGALPLGFDDAPPTSRRDRLVLGPLAAADLEALLDNRFGGRLPHRLLSRTLTAAAGNPLYAIELVAAHYSAGRQPEDSLRMPARLEEVLANRIGQLPAPTAEPLAAAACLAAPTVALVVAALGEGARAGLDGALDSDVVRVEEGRLQFAHPLHRVAALARVPSSTLRRLHTRLAVTTSDPEERARHLVMAADGPDTSVAAQVEQGADLARSRGAPEVAAELAEAAARLTPPGQVGDVRRRQVAAGYHWVMAGEVSRGRALLSTALDGMPPGPDRADLRWRLGMIAGLDGDVDQAVRLLEAALVEAGDQHAVRAMVAIRLAGLSVWLGRGEAAQRYAQMALEDAEISGDPDVLLRALTGFATLTYLAGAVVPAELLERVHDLAAVVGPPAAHEDPDLNLALVDMAAGAADAAAARLERVHRRAVEDGDELGLVWSYGFLVHVELAAGRWQRARQVADELMLATRHAASMPVLAPALLAAAVVDAHLGNVEAAQAGAVRLLEMAHRTGLVLYEIDARAILGFAAMSRNDPGAAHAEFSQVLGRLRELRDLEPTRTYLVWSDLDALVELGELDQAWALAADLSERGQRADRPFALATAARGRALVLAARGDLAGAEAELKRSLVEHDRLGWPFERARTLLALGIVLRRGKHKRAARETLLHALAIFDQLGARLWSAKATTELARIGGRPAPTGSLTPTERRVAELVADGRANQEVADQLFLSRKTVAAHLTAVYAKLGLRSRIELSHHLRDNPPHDPRT